MNWGKKATFLVVAFMVAGCSAKQESIRPEIVPAVMKKENSYMLGTIGEVEPVYILPMKTAFPARIDTGAKRSSIDAKKIKTFERDGEKWVSFVMIERETGETRKFEKELADKVTVRRAGDKDSRYAVNMDVRIGQEVINNVEFTLANREGMDYQVLIGRNILTGRAVVDTAQKNTLY